MPMAGSGSASFHISRQFAALTAPMGHADRAAPGWACEPCGFEMAPLRSANQCLCGFLHSPSQKPYPQLARLPLIEAVSAGHKTRHSVFSIRSPHDRAATDLAM